ncbi:MAG: outer membrane protein assembly factor BamE, partial [Mariprofundales bacterium]|nr:outer membrane protein assembly factor BamE [Mariprofundales bacterium]
IDQKVIDHKTTKTEVQAIFGAPMTTSFTSSGNVIWTYTLSQMSADATSYIPVVSMFAGSSSGTKKTLTILFDKNDVVVKHQMTEAPVKVRTGLFNQ